MRRHKLATYILRIQMRKYWAILRIRERRASVVLIRQFLVDTGKLGNSMSQIYKYRACVIKVVYIVYGCI